MSTRLIIAVEDSVIIGVNIVTLPQCNAVQMTSPDVVFWATFHPHDFTTVISFGRQQVNFWKLFWEPDKTLGLGRLLRDKHSGAFEVRISDKVLL